MIVASPVDQLLTSPFPASFVSAMAVEVMVSEVTTPQQKDAMEAADTKNVKVEVPTGMPLRSKLAHALATIVSGVIAVAVATVLADGTSVIRLKDAAFLKPATNPALKASGLSYRLDELLGSTYGIGLHHDQSGNSWTTMMAGANLKTLIANLGVPAVIAAVPSVIATDGAQPRNTFPSALSLR